MATKTISIDLDAYAVLVNARMSPKDSFSTVIKRARWDRRRKTCGGVLNSLPSLLQAPFEVLDRLERAQIEDAPPEDPRA